jgi:hypothetical protein
MYILVNLVYFVANLALLFPIWLYGIYYAFKWKDYDISTGKYVL